MLSFRPMPKNGDGHGMMSAAMPRLCLFVIACAIGSLGLSAATHDSRGDDSRRDDSRVPAEVRYKSSYVNPAPRPPDFDSAMPWGIAIADTRVPNFQNAQVEVERTELSCRVDGKDVVLN